MQTDPLPHDLQTTALNELHAEISGVPGRAVVLMHGQPGTAGDWRRVVALLENRYEVLALDRPGYGATSGQATGFAGNARAVVGLLDRLGLARAAIVGHSWAGGAAIWTAATYPERVSGLVLVSSVGPVEHLTWSDRILGAPLAGEAIAAIAATALGLATGSARIRSLADSRLPEQARETYSYLASLAKGQDRLWRSFLVEQRHLLTELGELAPLLGQVSAPTVVLHGAADRSVEPAVARHLAGCIPGAELSMIAAAGHLLPRDRPDAVAAAVDAVAARWQ
jgi:pimeloyl-ACP methyl ester carboxylesterase